MVLEPTLVFFIWQYGCPCADGAGGHGTAMAMAWDGPETGGHHEP